MTRTVTPDASVASDRFNEREPASRFLPDDDKYRLTGEISEGDLEVAGTQRTDGESHIPEGVREEREQEHQERKPVKKGASAASTEQGEEEADTEGASAASDSDTAAASEAASTQNTRTPAKSETRWQRLSRENRELREKNARLEGERAGRETTRDTSQASQTATTAKPATGDSVPKPQISDVDPATGKPKYKSFADYEAAKDQWLTDEAVRKFQQQSTQSSQEQRQREAEAEIGRSLAKKFEGTRAKYKDFDQVALGEHLTIPQGSVTDMFLVDSDHAGEVAYYLGQHPEITQGFYQVDTKTGRFTNKITPQRQFRKLMEIEAQVAGSAGEGAGSGEGEGEGEGEQPAPGKRSARPITKAPPPPNQVSGKGTVSKDPVVDAVEHGDSEAYMRQMNARILGERSRK
jgi:hypothetical protein